jgi:serine/threonine-protein kinase
MGWGRLLRWAVAVLGGVAGCAVSAWLVLWVSLRSSAVRVPAVTGLDGARAFAVLQESGLLARIQEDVFDATVPVGKIARQRPGAGLEVKRGTTVRLFPSQGSEVQTVRSFAGLPLSLAEAELEGLGLRAGRQCRVEEQAQAAVLVAHTPPAGASIAPGGEVALLVNTVPHRRRYVMPDFVEIDEAVASRIIRALGFRLATLQYVSYPAIRPGIVLKQIPLAGGPVSEAEVVGLWVSR